MSYTDEVVADAPILNLRFDDWTSTVVSGLQATVGTGSSSSWENVVTEWIETQFIDYGDGANGATNRVIPGSIGQTTQMALQWTGTFVAPLSGTYTFGTRSDDNSAVVIDTTTVVTRGSGTFTAAENTGTISLTAGQTYLFRYQWQQGTSQYGATCRWQAPGGSGMVGLFAASNSVTLPFQTLPKMVDSSGYGRDFWQGVRSSQATALVPNEGGYALGLSSSWLFRRDTSFNQLTAWTIETWMTIDTLPTGTTSPAIFTTEVGSPSRLPLVLGFCLDQQAGNSQKLGIGFFDGTWRMAHWTTTPTVGVRYHIVGSYDGTTLRLRVNNVEVATTTVSLTVTSTTSTRVRIGRRWDNADFLAAKLDHLAVYNKRLSDARASAHYTAGVDGAGAAALSAAANMVADHSGEVTGAALLSARGDLAAADYLLLDRFNRTDSASTVGGPEIGSAGTANSGTWGLINGELYASAGSENVYTWPLGQVDYDVSMVLSTINASMGLICRCVDATNYLLFHVDTAPPNSVVTFYQRVAGTYTALDVISGVPHGTDSVFRAVCQGDLIQFFIDGRLVFSRQEGRFASTGNRVGLRTINGVTRIGAIEAHSWSQPVATRTADLYTVAINADGSSAGHVHKGRDSASLDSGSAV